MGKNMCYYIGIEDLAANAMIEVMERRMRNGEPLVQPCITFKNLEAYGYEVVDYINRETDESASLILSRASTVCMFRNYSEYFEETEDEKSIRLREGKTAEELKYAFRTYRALKLVNAYMKESAVSILNENCG